MIEDEKSYSVLENSGDDVISAQPLVTPGQSAPGLCNRFTAGIRLRE